MRFLRIGIAAFVLSVAVSAVSFAAQAEEEASPNKSAEKAKETPITLSAEHAWAVDRPRRLIDMGGLIEPWQVGPKRWIDWRFSLLDQPAGTQIDSLWTCIDEGNVAYYPSKVLPVEVTPEFKPWFDAGADVLQVTVEETHKRKLETFFAYRINGYDRDFEDKAFPQPMKRKHPDWLIQGEGAWTPEGLWNFAKPGVHDYKVRILREVAENYDFDGIFIDFARLLPYLPVGHQWEHRDALTAFMRKMRLMLQDVAAERKRPYLLAVRVPATVPGCHYDGIDIEAWAKQNLVDLIIMGCRSIDVDVAGFRRVVSGSHIKLYPSLDDAHSPDGYRFPPIEFFRGMCANWWHQGVDGILAFNLYNATPEAGKAVGQHELSHPVVHNQVFREVGDPEAMRFQDKMFVVPRRFGAGWEERWHTYHNSNSQAPLPETLTGRDRPVLLPLYVADDVAGNAERVKRLELRLLTAGAIPTDAIQVKVNGVYVPAPEIQEGGWRVFQAAPNTFAIGPNLVSIRLNGEPADRQTPIVIEKVEVHVAYKDAP